MRHIRILFDRQRLELLDDSNVIKSYPVSTAEKGPGEQMGSYCTPRGEHLVRAKIGARAPLNTVFVERRPTGEIFNSELDAQHPGRDWILTRILWLSGLESGFNRGGCVDTMRRYIYIHGTPDRVALGRPESKGCVRMRNADIVELFDLIPVGAHVTLLTNG
ncbi:MAG: L,D-transpeptidase family protein [Burkholderiales bacterium]